MKTPENTFEVGDMVTYDPGYKRERGIVKSFSGDETHVFVVYNCNDDWENYGSYTAARTRIADLKHGWE